MKQETTYTLEDVVDAIGDIDTDHKNDHGYTLGDELHEMNWRLERIAVALEKIVTRMPIQY
jgi:hypothetical protein